MNTKNEFLIDNDILIVDDINANLEVLMIILQDAGYKVRAANSGELALQTIKTKLPALILLDILMPGMDGYELCSRLKVDETTRSIPIIFI